jgi:hypothetical protein
MKTFLTVIAALTVAALPIAGAEKTPKLPAYPGQPSINAAVKSLTAAQEKLTSNQADALVHLKKAQGSLEHAIKDKGSFRATAIRLTKQAIRHLEGNDPTTAAHEIEEAIENANRAGVQGAR